MAGRNSITAIVKKDVFKNREYLEARYGPDTVAAVVRVRDMYTWLMSNPEWKDRQLVARQVEQFGCSLMTAYNDLATVKYMLPMFVQTTRDFHRWRANEMLLETYRMAKDNGDTKTMERAAASYAKYNRIDLEDELKIPYEEIMVQPFTATDDPSVLGIKPVPNIREKIRAMIEKYTAESADIEDVEYEEADLEESELFNDADDGSQEGDE